MKKTSLLLFLMLFLVLSLVLAPATRRVQAQAGNAYDLIAAVNALRTAQGLTALEVDGSLMAAAQSHSEYQAGLGYWTHEGPGGSRPRDRAIAAGYGSGSTVFVSENVAVLNPTASFDTLIYSIWSDALHWNTMTNPSYTHAGAGVVVAGDEVYYTLDVGYVAGSPGGYLPVSASTSAGQMQAATPDTSNQISSLVTATPHTDGSVWHTVEQGHSLWAIAIAYGTTINALIELNNLDPQNPSIWPGTDLLVQPSLQPSNTVPPSATLAQATRTPRPSQTPRPPTPTRTPTIAVTPTHEPAIQLNAIQSMDRRTLGIIIIALCAVGLATVVFTGFLRRR